MATVEIRSKIIGWLMVSGALLLFVPYSVLTIIFDYPGILREDAGTVLATFHEGGNVLIWTWFAFAMVGLPLLPALVLLGQKMEERLPFVRWATSLGVIGLVVQIIGLLRWTFVVPVLAQNFVTGNPAMQEASKVGFQVVHQYGGVVLGEHLGQLFTIAWTVAMTTAFTKMKLIPVWMTWLGTAASGIYLLAQAELFATVMPGFPVWGFAGFLGSTLWLVWLAALGVVLIKSTASTSEIPG